MRLLKFFGSLAIIFIATSASAQTNATLSATEKADCNQRHSFTILGVGITNQPMERIVSSTPTAEGTMNTVEAFNRVSLDYNKTGPANTILQVFVGNKIQFTGQVAAGNKRSNIILNNVKGKVIKVKITNLSPTIENKRADFEIEIKGMTSSLFKRGYAMLEQGSPRTMMAVGTEKTCTYGTRVVLTSLKSTGTTNDAFARIVIRKNDLSGTILATENLLKNTTSKEIYIANGCLNASLSIQIEYINNNNRIPFKYKVEAFSVVPVGQSPPPAPQQPM